MGRQLGVTLLELLVAITIMGVLAAVAVPAFSQMILSNRLTTAANDVVAALAQARLEAVRRNSTTQFCSNVAATNGAGALATACGSSGGAIYILNNGGTASKLRDALVVPAGTGLASSGTGVMALQFGGQGLARRPGVTTPYNGLIADIQSTRISQNNQRCIYVTSGSVISTCVLTSTSGGVCPTNEPPNCQGQ